MRTVFGKVIRRIYKKKVRLGYIVSNHTFDHVLYDKPEFVASRNSQHFSMALNFSGRPFSVSMTRRDENNKYLDRTAVVVVAIRAPAVHGVSSMQFSFLREALFTSVRTVKTRFQIGRAHV